MAIITPSIKIIMLQNKRAEKAMSNVLATPASTHIHTKALGFLINEVNVTQKPISIKSNTTPHQIAIFLNEKFNTLKDGKGIAFAIPISNIMGVNFYNVLSNNKSSFL